MWQFHEVDEFEGAAEGPRGPFKKADPILCIVPGEVEQPLVSIQVYASPPVMLSTGRPGRSKPLINPDGPTGLLSEGLSRPTRYTPQRNQPTAGVYDQ